VQLQLLTNFTDFHQAFPAAKRYAIPAPTGPTSGIGATDEYFSDVFHVPSWTLEIEPQNGGVDYGGFGNNGHDGFILPESEITRVREQLAQTFIVAWYRQAGPPSLTQFRIVDKETGVLIYDASWDIVADGTRELYVNSTDNLIDGKDYQIIVSFDKPMRVRDENDLITNLQGQNFQNLNAIFGTKINGEEFHFSYSNPRWINTKDNSVDSYTFYKDDTFTVDFTLPDDLSSAENQDINWSIDVFDMLGQKLDSNPATVATWSQGQWRNYEGSAGEESISGGIDNNYSTVISNSSANVGPPAVLATALYFDPQRSGEGFSYEILNDTTVWLQWFTYDSQGNQKWYSGIGIKNANTIIADRLIETHNGVFGGEFDSEAITRTTFGSLEIVFNENSDANGFDAKVLFTDTKGKKLRTNLQKLTTVTGVVASSDALIIGPPVLIDDIEGMLSGSWYDPNRSGEGYIIEILTDGTALILWYTYDLDGNLMWMLDSGGEITVDGNNVQLDFSSLKITNGGIFGEDFNPDDVNRIPWGEMHFDLTIDCATNTATGSVSYDSVIEGFGSGQYNITQLTRPMTYLFACGS
jgi:hypothetical protein